MCHHTSLRVLMVLIVSTSEQWPMSPVMQSRYKFRRKRITYYHCTWLCFKSTFLLSTRLPQRPRTGSALAAYQVPSPHDCTTAITLHGWTLHRAHVIWQAPAGPGRTMQGLRRNDRMAGTRVLGADGARGVRVARVGDLKYWSVMTLRLHDTAAVRFMRRGSFEWRAAGCAGLALHCPFPEDVRS